MEIKNTGGTDMIPALLCSGNCGNLDSKVEI